MELKQLILKIVEDYNKYSKLVQIDCWRLQQTKDYGIIYGLAFTYAEDNAHFRQIEEYLQYIDDNTEWVTLKMEDRKLPYSEIYYQAVECEFRQTITAYVEKR